MPKKTLNSESLQPKMLQETNEGGVVFFYSPISSVSFFISALIRLTHSGPEREKQEEKEELVSVLIDSFN